MNRPNILFIAMDDLGWNDLGVGPARRNTTVSCFD